MDQDRARLRLRDDGDGGFRGDAVEREDAPEAGEPFAFDAFLEHGGGVPGKLNWWVKFLMCSRHSVKRINFGICEQSA